MTRLYLNKPNVRVRKNGGRLEVVTPEGAVLEKVPVGQLDQVVVVGRGVDLSTALTMELVRRGIGVAYLTAGGDYLYGWEPATGVGARTRAGQYALLGSPQGALRFAKMVVRQKVAAQAEHLRRLGVAERLVRSVAAAGALAERAQTLDAVRGQEGGAAAVYFQSWVPLVGGEWGFVGRRHYPAPDPLNALLSFAYTMLLHEVSGKLRLAGADPQFGALHVVEGARPSLALDVEEPFRPLGVDVWVLELLRKGAFVPADFAKEDGGVRLRDEPRRRFLKEYQRAMERRVRHPLQPGRITVRDAIDMHARMTARLFLGEVFRIGKVL